VLLGRLALCCHVNKWNRVVVVVAAAGRLSGGACDIVL